MEDDFPFPLRVEGDWDASIPKLKNKLNIYFQSRKANGGDCSVEYESSDGQRAVVWFKTEEVRQRVLNKQGHELKLGRGLLKLTVRLPQSEETSSNFPETSDEISDEKGPSAPTQGETKEVVAAQEEKEAEEELQTVSVLLENIPEKMNSTMIELLVENISDTSMERGDFSLEIMPDISVAVVSFKESKHTSTFLSEGPRNKLFMKNKLSARALEVTKTVKVDNIPPSVSNDYLRLYFKMEGKEEVEDVKQLEDEECTAFITFRHHKGVNQVTKKILCINGMRIGVYPYYESLGTALYGKERPTLKLPDSFTESMDSAVWKFLQDKQLVEEINEVMAGNFCKVDLQSSEVLISPLRSLLKKKGLTAKDINHWKEKANATFHLAISKFQSFDCKVMPAVWEESETEIRRALTEAVVIAPDMARGVVTLAGLAEDVNKVKDVLEGIVGTATRRLERERDSITAEASVAPSLYHILQQDRLPQKLATDYPELKMTYSPADQKVILCGLSAEVYAAKIKVLEQVMAMKRKMVEVDEDVLAFLSEADKEQLCNCLFTEEGIKATYDTCDRRVQLLGGTDQALCDAEKQLKTTLSSYSIEVEDETVLSKPEWQNLVTRLKESFNSPVKRVKVRRTGYDTKQEVIVSGFQGAVNLVQQELFNFISNNTIIEFTLDVKSRATLKFIQDWKKESWSEAVKRDVQVNFNYETRSPNIWLRGSRAHMADVKNLLQNTISSVHFDTLKIAKPGAKKFFKEKWEFVENAAAKTGCLIQLVEDDPEDESSNDDDDGQDMGDAMQKTMPPARLAVGDKQLGKVQASTSQDRTQTREGLTIILSKGNIQDASTDVVVNILGESLSLDSGNVSRAILHAAGEELQTLLQAEVAGSKPATGAVLVTKGCNLKSKNVFHALAPHWDKGKGKTDQVLERIVEQCLEKAEELQQRSIAFPAIGSGNLGFPKDFVASMLLGQVVSFSSKTNLKHLQEVVIVLHPSDAQTSQAFYTEFSKRFAGISSSLSQPANPATAPTQPGKALFSKVTGIAQGHEMRVGGVLLQVVTGDITAETSDVIVNSSNADFSLRSGVSKAILDAAGPTVDAECKQLGAQANKDMIMTQPGNLKSKKIIHIVGQTDVAKIIGSVKAVLQMCAQHKFTSVSFPALGTGQGGVGPSQVADAMLDAVEEVVKQDPAMSLRLVRLVIFQTPMLTHFHSSMQKRESMGIQPQAPKGVISKLAMFFKSGKQEGKKIFKTFRLEGKTLEAAIFHLCGDSQASVDQGKRWIQELFHKELAFERITDEAILHLSDEDKKKIQDLQQQLQVSLKLEEGDPEATIIVEGLSRDVLKAGGKIRCMLKTARDQQTQNRDADLLCNLVEWQYQQGGQYVAFDKLVNLHLERAMQNQKPEVKIEIERQPYKVSLPNGPAVDSGGKPLQIKRVDKQEEQDTRKLPEHWSAMKADQPCLTTPLQPGDAEYKEVLNLFQATCKNPVSKIERVQNPCLWMNYQILKQTMNQTNGHQNNEKRLFHGTSEPTIQHINHRGFNRSYAGKNAAAFGNGTYFAVGANYSAQNTYSVPDAQGQKYMYLCRVLTGDFTNGRSGMIVPPPKSNASHVLYNSVTDNAASMFIIFNDIQAYPEYLITFR
ncbi:poly(ADP-ribose) polymerase family member 14-related sequence 1 isoform X2 [Conger conger]|uniref:poly(ADP-ribose) polymerase family member 14-related sequence 1 isoform X2 n=1 Tax=Conger conger TaxID=82655 RepID=UPI002A59BCF3|nr:poly(ADP-ribose) polymerase family member 14-related sequence 1 isoform X2 [Conger conger]